MDYLLSIDWSRIFAPQLTLPEVLVRGTVVYFALLFLLRVIPKWQAGPGNIASMLFVVLLGGLAADAVRGHTESVTDILLMIATVTLWVVLVDRLSFRSTRFRFVAQDSPTCLIRQGRILHKNLERETITEDDLKTQLRSHGVNDIRQVRAAYLEADGSISVVREDSIDSASPVPDCDTTDPETTASNRARPRDDV